MEANQEMIVETARETRHDSAHKNPPVPRELSVLLLLAVGINAVLLYLLRFPVSFLPPVTQPALLIASSISSLLLFARSILSLHHLHSRQQETESILSATLLHLQSTNLRLNETVITDTLTGVKNHRAFQEKFEAEYERARRYNTRLSLILLDIDSFHSFNQIYGHLAGDSALQRVAKIIRQCARECDFIARYGGEEFILLLPETGSEGAMVFAERIRKAVSAVTDLPGPVTVSIGVSTIGLFTKREDLLEEANAALQHAKKSGRNQVYHAFTETS